MHDLCIFLICFCSKIIFDQNISPLCWDKLDYPGSIVYLSCSATNDTPFMSEGMIPLNDNNQSFSGIPLFVKTSIAPYHFTVSLVSPPNSRKSIIDLGVLWLRESLKKIEIYIYWNASNALLITSLITSVWKLLISCYDQSCCLLALPFLANLSIHLFYLWSEDLDMNWGIRIWFWKINWYIWDKYFESIC